MDIVLGEQPRSSISAWASLLLAVVVKGNAKASNLGTSNNDPALLLWLNDYH